MEIVCPDCLAHYPEQYDRHDCPPWLKALVDMKKAKDAAEGEESDATT